MTKIYFYAIIILKLKNRESELIKMPRHICNTIKFKKEDRKKFEKFMEEDCFDFNKLIPMPKEFSKMGGDHGEVEEIAKEWKEFTKDVNEINASNVDEYIEKFRNEVRNNPEKYPFSRRYFWRLENWGSKWNAYKTHFGEEYLYFQTAQDAPLPIFEKMANLNPDTWFQVKYCDEATGRNCGIVEYKPNFFPSENEDNMAKVEYNDVTGELKIIETGFFKNTEDAPEKFNAIIGININGTLILYEII